MIRIIKLDFVNAYLLDDFGDFILIDTGLPQQFAAIDRELTEAGCRPGNLRLIVITHGDWDHTGNAVRLRDKYKTQIAMHRGDLEQVERGVQLKRKIRPLSYRLLFKVRMLMRKLRKTKISFTGFRPDIFLEDGQSLSPYGLAAKVIHVPGHTPGSIGILGDGGDFFAGDTFVNAKNPDTARIIENQSQLESSLEKLKKLNIKTVYPGHGAPFLIQNLKKFCSIYAET